MRLFVIRHGETVGDVEDRYGGAYDDVLSAEGEAQVHRLAEELAGSEIGLVYSSPLTRARQTAQGLAHRVGCGVVVMDGLKERDQYGPLTGMTKSEARQKYPEWVEQVKDRMNTLPEAESYGQASARMREAFAEVVERGDPCAALVWHGGGMRVLFREILRLGELQKIGDCCWVELERRGERFEVVRKVRIG